MRKSVIIVVLVLIPVSFAHAQISAVDRAALIAFYNGTDGANWSNNTNWLGPAGTECTWFGVECRMIDANPLEMYVSDIYTISVNLAGLPGITIPAGLDSDNLPIGLQLIGPVLSESTLLRTARMFEKTTAPIIPPMAT